MEELKELQLDMMQKIDEFCRSNDINYTLYFGTLLGAIRHKGYIPWDDDIDIAMPRPSYNKFLSLFNGAYDNLRVIAPELNPNFYAPYANVYDDRTLLLEGRNSHRGIEIGIKIDVFPIDGVADEFREFKKIKNKINRLANITSIKRTKLNTSLSYTNVKLLLRKMQFSLVSYSKIQNKIIELARKNDFNSSNFADNIVFQVPDAVLERRVYENFVDVKFERLNLRSISAYDDYLRKAYGDYMKLPPIEERQPHHGFVCYWK